MAATISEKPQRRLLVASLSPGRGGAEEYAKTIALGAAGAGWNVRFAAPDIEPIGPILNQLRVAGVTHIVVPPVSKGRRGQLVAILGFFKAVVSARPHAVLLGLPWPRFAFGQLLTCALLGVPTVVIFHLVPEFSEAMRHEIEPRRRLYDWARTRRQTWIAVSEHVRLVVIQLFGTRDDAVRCIHNGVPLDPAVGAAPRAVDAGARAAVGLTAREFVILSVGRLTPQKGHDQLIRAVGMIAERHPEIRVLLAGDGPDRDQLEELAERLGIAAQVRLLGRVDAPRRLHAASDLFAFPSRYEGTPLAMLEAMAGGLPVLATRFRGVDEVIEDGREGLLVDLGDAAGMADAIETLIADRSRLESMAVRSRSTVERFSQDTMVKETLAVLDRAVSS